MCDLRTKFEGAAIVAASMLAVVFLFHSKRNIETSHLRLRKRIPQSLRQEVESKVLKTALGKEVPPEKAFETVIKRKCNFSKFTPRPLCSTSMRFKRSLYKRPTVSGLTHQKKLLSINKKFDSKNQEKNLNLGAPASTKKLNKHQKQM